jgi:hypothetical protein
MLDPELADVFVRVRQREAVGRLGMREAGGVEIQADADFLGPVNPVLEMLRLDFVAVHFLAAELAVERVQVEAVLAGNERQRLLGVGAQFVRRAGLAGIIAGGDEAAAERAAEIFKAAHVVALPAMEGDGDW